MIPNQRSYLDLTQPFNLLWGFFTWAYNWSVSHGFFLWNHWFSFFDVAMGVFATYLIVDLIPMFGDPEDDSYVYDDFGGF